MKITFYCDSIPFHLDSLTTHPLGGTESSVISLSKELGKLGHQVTIIGKTSSYHQKGNVEFMPVTSCDLKYWKSDVFVSVRDVSVLVQNDLSNLGKIIFWSHDVKQHPSIEHLLSNTQGVVDKTDAVVIISDFVEAQLSDESPNLTEKLHIIRNGVDSDLLKEPKKDNEFIHCTYHSMAYRGLVYLLDMWPSIVARVPNAKLHIYSGDQIYGNVDQNNWIWNRAKRYGVDVEGAVCQEQLLTNLSSMDIHLYPTDFVESSCTATMMSLASGCCVVTTDLGALREQINASNGYLIEGHPGSENYQQFFISTVVNLMLDRSALLEKQSCSTSMQSETWSKRALEWLDLIERI